MFLFFGYVVYGSGEHTKTLTPEKLNLFADSLENPKQPRAREAVKDGVYVLKRGQLWRRHVAVTTEEGNKAFLYGS